MNIANALFAQFRRNKSEFWRRLITVDESWVHHYTPETKIQSKQWTAKGEPAPKEENIVFFFGWEGDCDIFWDNYLNRLSSKMKAYYRNILLIIEAEGRKCRKRPHLQKKNILFHQEKASSPPQRLSWRESTNYGLNCLTICLIHQIWPQTTSFCSLI